jgi:hypothetical protein
MFRRSWVFVCGIAVLVLTAVSVQGVVLSAKTDAQKHRQDIGKQLGKYIDCLSKAAIKCEKKGSDSGVECDLETGTAAGSVDPKAAAKFTADVAKCDLKKFDPAKKQKTSDYEQIGCPSDCDPGTDGVQRCADLGAYESLVEDGSNPTGVKAQIGLLAFFIEALCSVHVGEPVGTSEAVIDCVANDAKFLGKYAKGVLKCGEKCEGDYKDKKGNGGPNDDPNCRVGDAGADANFTACLTKKADKHLAKVQAPDNATAVKGAIDDALNGAADDLFNKDDPSVDETDMGSLVCSDCGNNTREGIEDCDGTDDAACSGSCNSDCTCP